MNLLYAVFFGAGVAAFAYTKLGRRIGYGNSQDVFIITAIAFVFASVFFFAFLSMFVTHD